MLIRECSEVQGNMEHWFEHTTINIPSHPNSMLGKLMVAPSLMKPYQSVLLGVPCIKYDRNLTPYIAWKALTCAPFNTDLCPF